MILVSINPVGSSSFPPVRTLAAGLRPAQALYGDERLAGPAGIVNDFAAIRASAMKLSAGAATRLSASSGAR